MPCVCVRTHMCGNCTAVPCSSHTNADGVCEGRRGVSPVLACSPQMGAVRMVAWVVRRQSACATPHTGHAPDDSLLADMAAKGLVSDDGEGYDLAEDGRKLFVETLAFGKALEADLADHFSEGEIAETKRVLRRIIELTGDEVPINWRNPAD